MALQYKIPAIVRFFYKDAIWKIPEKNKTIYLTFDDGPIPGLTEKVLNILKDFDARATFFCVGDNIRKHKEVFTKILDNNHSVGNHTFNHLNGWKTANDDYYENIKKADLAMENAGYKSKIKLLRPPYGKIKKSQLNTLKNTHKVIMWDILTYDFKYLPDIDHNFSKIVKLTSQGSIVVFHDNIKAESNVLNLLPRYLKYFSENGFSFAKLEDVFI